MRYIGERPFSSSHGGGPLCLFISPVPDPERWVQEGNSISYALVAAHEVAQLRDQLGEEVGPERCRSQGCSRLRIANSVLCREHHMAMLRRVGA
jgi:hypothetical protein